MPRQEASQRIDTRTHNLRAVLKLTCSGAWRLSRFSFLRVVLRDPIGHRKFILNSLFASAGLKIERNKFDRIVVCGVLFSLAVCPLARISRDREDTTQDSLIK